MRVKKEVTRRQFLKGAGAGLLYLAYEYCSFNLAKERSKNLEIFHHVIGMSSIDKKWDKTLIIHLSDAHISSRGVDFMNPELMQHFSVQLSNYLKFINADQKKTILIDTGDLVSVRTGNNRPTNLADLNESLKYISHIPVMVRFSVEGNHDVDHPQSNEIANILDDHEFFRLGLQNQNNYLFDHDSLPFTLVGLPDFTTREKSWFDAQGGTQFLNDIQNRDSQKPMVFATHTSMIDSFRGGVLQRQVSNSLFLHGHTHGGQIFVKSPMGHLAGRYAVYGKWKAIKGEQGYYFLRKSRQTSKYYRGVYKLANNNIISISPGLGHAATHGPRFVPPGAVIYEIRVL